MSEILDPPNSPAAEESQPPADMVTSEEFIAELRALMARVPDVPTLTPMARRTLQRLGRVSESEARAAINVVQASDKVASTVEETAEVQEMLEAANRWTAAESELKAAWRKVADANLVRWNRIANFASLTYGIGTKLAQHPENDELVPHLREVRRVRRSHHRRKPAANTPPVTPTPQEP